MGPADGNPISLNRRYGQTRTIDLMERCIGELFGGRIACVSSFSGQSVVLLHMVARIDPSTKVVFLDTDKHFGETLTFRDRVVDRLGLTNVHSIAPDQAGVTLRDPDGMLFADDPDSCCNLRKVEPLARALAGTEAWISGRKRFQGGQHANIKIFESEGLRIKINPLAHWSVSDLSFYRSAHELPVHPLVAQGFLSIGCMPCTERAVSHRHQRSGRWRSSQKTECGIHTPMLTAHNKEF
jgi:phosphoadenosine phosphosulfate reductase